MRRLGRRYPQTMRLYRQTESEWRKEDIEKFMTARPCNACNGKKLQPLVLAVKILDKSIIDATDLSIEEAVDFFHDLPPKLNEKDLSIAKQVLKEINERLALKTLVRLPVFSRLRRCQAEKPNASDWQRR
jgi:excinuclease ABC subunit A